VANNWEIACTKPTFKANIFMIYNRGFILNHLLFWLLVVCTFNLNYTVTDQPTLKRNISLELFQQLFGRIRTNNGENSKCFRLGYQNPSFHEYWINSSTTQKRFDFLNRILTATILLTTHSQLE
jgi:hypothetical protein